MTPPHKLLVVEAQDRVVGVEELGVEDDLDAIRRPVEELYSADLVQDGVVRVVGHVVRRDGRERVAAEGEDATLEEDLVFVRKQSGGFGNFGSVLSINPSNSQCGGQNGKREAKRTQCTSPYAQKCERRCGSEFR